MMALYIDRALGYTRMAMTEDGRLALYLIEGGKSPLLEDTVWKGRVIDCLKGMQAAYIDIGLGKNAYLPLGPGKPALRQGQEVLVTVAAQPDNPEKGVRVQLYPALAGRWMVYCPQGGQIGASRRLEAAQRDRLCQVLSDMLLPGEGAVGRTQAAMASAQQLQAELDHLRLKAQQIQALADGMTAPALVWQPDALASWLADVWLGGMPIRVADAALKEKISAIFVSWGMPIPDIQVKGQDLFYMAGIDSALQKAMQRQVWLPCGGQLVFDKTEAMWVIDVNSAKYAGRMGAAQAALKVNLEAAREAMRQIRLRDLSGTILIDLITMRERGDQQQVLDVLKELAQKDPVPTQIYGITALGIAEISRAKRRKSLPERILKAVPVREEIGENMRALMLIRRAQALQSQGARACITAPQAVLDAVTRLWPDPAAVLVPGKKDQVSPVMGQA
nr:ribonuclease E/G [bacterium]